MILTMNLADRSYPIVVEAGALNRLNELFALERKVLIVTDANVPAAYAQRAAAACKSPVIVTLPAGEKTKCFASLERLCCELLDNGFTRTDAVLAVGGGVVGDLAGFAAACFMRGIDFYNVPTTLLSQVDSSIGGKTAIDLKGTKNIVGAFWQPKGVVVDPQLLATLPRRQLANGMAEVIKMAATSDKDLFCLLEEQDPFAHLEEVILAALKIKKSVVEQDEKEAGLRRVLNFGHTVGHAIEALCPQLYHGECVALGTLVTSSKSVQERLVRLYQRVGLPTQRPCDLDRALELVAHDKKADQDRIRFIYVETPGSFEQITLSLKEFNQRIKECAKI